MRYRVENFVENSVNKGYKERRLEIALCLKARASPGIDDNAG
jgi:hypothetical protein